MAVNAGELSAKVRPDTKGFGPALKKYLERIERTNELRLHIELDSDGLRNQARKAAEAAGKGTQVKLDTTIDSDQLAKQAAKAVKDSERNIPAPKIPTPDIPKIPPVEVPFDPLTQALQADVKRELAKLAKEVNVSIPLGADGDGLRSDIARQITAIEKTLKAQIPTEPGDRRDYERALRAQVDGLSERIKATIKVKADVDKDQLESAVSSAVSGAERKTKPFKLPFDLGDLGALTGNIAKIAGGAVAIAGLAAGAVQAAGAISSLVVAVIPLMGLLLAIPAAAAIAGVAFGALAIGTMGLAGAFTALASGDAEAIDGALKGLAPSARDLVKEIAALGPAFSDLKLDVQQALFAGLGDKIGVLAKAGLPSLSDAFVRVATAVNGGLKAVLDVLSSPQGLAGLGVVVDSAAGSVEKFSTSFGPLTNAFIAVAAAAAPFVESLAGKLSEWLSDFSDKAARFAASGGVAKALNDGVTVLKQLISIGKDATNVISGIFKAGGGTDGSSALDTLKSLLDTLNKAVNSAEGQSGIGAVLKNLRDIAKSLEEPLKSLLNGLKPVANIIGDLATSLSGGLDTTIDNLAKGLGRLEITAKPVGDALSDLLDAASPLLEPLGQLADTILGPLSDALGDWADGAKPLIKQLADELSPALSNVKTALTDMFTELKPIIAAYQRLQVEILPILIPLLVDLGALLIEVISWALKLLGPIIVWVIDRFVEWIQWIKDLWAAIKELDLEKIAELIGEFVAKANEYFLKFLLKVEEVLSELPAKIGTWVTKAQEKGLELLATFVASMTAKAAELPGKISDALATLASKVGDKVTEAANRAIAELRSGADSLQNIATGIPGRILNALSSLPEKMFSAGQNVVGRLIDGLKSKIPSLSDIANKIASAISFKLPNSPAKEGPLSGHGDPLRSGGVIVQRLITGLSRHGGDAELAAESLAGRIAGPLSEPFIPNFSTSFPQADPVGVRSDSTKVTASGGVEELRVVDIDGRYLMTLVRAAELQNEKR